MLTSPPSPRSPSPTASVMEPPWPLVAAPVRKWTSPVEPAEAAPVLRLSSPLTPDEPPLAVPIITGPDSRVLLDPLCISRLPPGPLIARPPLTSTSPPASRLMSPSASPPSRRTSPPSPPSPPSLLEPVPPDT